MVMLSNYAAVVTGAASGIGKAAALRLVKEGAKVALLDIKEEKAEQVRNEIIQNGGECLVFDTDIADPARVEAAIQKVNDKWGEIQIVFANAGINGTLSPIEDLSPSDWDETITTNLKSTFLTVKYSIPYMKAKGGSIIITSSINGNRTFSGFGMSAYSTSKAGQMAFGKMAALELARYRIRVNIICPGAIKTNIKENTHPDKEKLKKIEIPVQFPEGNQPLEHRAGMPEQVADLVCFLASPFSSHITGTEIYIDGAESLL